jgi:hypothetical protein
MENRERLADARHCNNTFQEDTFMTFLTVLAQQGDNGGGLAGLIGSLLYLAILVVVIAGMWKMYVKAGQPGWAAIIPIYNVIVLMRIVGRPAWWFLLLFIPVVNFIILIITMLDLAKAFGKGTGFALGLIFLSPIFMPILGFGDARYVGPNGGGAPAMA